MHVGFAFLVKGPTSDRRSCKDFLNLVATSFKFCNDLNVSMKKSREIKVT